MKQSAFIAIFVATQVGFLVLHINKHSQLIKLSYAKQQCEQERDALTQKKQSLLQQLYALKSPESIKNFARTKLQMKDLALSQIKKIPSS